MKTTERRSRENGAALRATRLVSLALALLGVAGWIAARGYISSRSAPSVSVYNSNRSSRSAHLNARSPSTSSSTSQVTSGATNVWTTNGPGAYVSSLAMDPSNPAILYAAADCSLFKTTNSGASWTVVNTGTPNPHALAIAPSNSNVIYAGQGPIGLKSTDDGANWTYWEVGWFAVEGASSLAIDPGNPNTIYTSFSVCDYSAGCDGVLFKSTDGARNWGFIGYANFSGPTDLSVPIAFDAANPNTIYVGSFGGVSKSIDGANWNFFSEGLPSRWIWALAIDPTEPKAIYAGTEDGFVYKSTDGGERWSSGSSLGSTGIVDALVVDPSHPNNIYAGTRGSGVFRSTDAGANWSELNDGLTDLRINALVIDESGTQLHAGTSVGVFDMQLSEVAPGPNTVQFSSASYNISEGSPRIDITLNRSGDTTGGASVGFTTNDAAALQDCNIINGIASPRCDYINTIGIVRFGAGETSKSFSVAIVDDSYAEGNETFNVSLNNVSGATLGTQSTATVTIVDNDSANGTNPIDDRTFWVRQHYIDFLGREPEPAGYQGWLDILNNCPFGSPACDPVEVSSAFFRSPEFQERGYFTYRFYPILGKVPLYSEFTPDLAKVSGFLTTEELEIKKATFVSEVMTRPEFRSKYDSLTTPAGYVDGLLQTVELPNHPTRQTWIDGLTNGSITRAQVVRGLVESPEMYNKYYNEAFVVMQYFGYLRRSADGQYLQWIQTMNSNGGDYRAMINGFLNSAEYRQRFGP